MSATWQTEVRTDRKTTQKGKEDHPWENYPLSNSHVMYSKKENTFVSPNREVLHIPHMVINGEVLALL